MTHAAEILKEYDKESLIAILSSVGDGIIISDKSGIVEFANGKTLEILEQSWQDIRGAYIGDVFKIYNEYSVFSYNYFENVIEGSISEGGLDRSSYILTPTGNKKYISIQLSSIDSTSYEKKGFVLILRDITRLVSIEKQSINEKNNLLNLFNELPIGMLLLDDKIIIQQVNKALLTTFDLIEDQVVGQPFGNAINCIWSFKMGCGKSEECMFCSFRKKVTQLIFEGVNVNNHLEEIEIQSNGQNISKWIAISFMPMKHDEEPLFLITVEDVTGRVNHERTLELARKSSLSILNSLPVMIYRINEKKECDFINLTFKSIFEFEEDRFFEDIGEYMTESMYQEFVFSLNESILNKASFKMEIDIYNNHGERRFMLAVGKPDYDHNNKYVGLIGIFLDMTDAKLSDIKYRKSQQKYYSLFQNMDDSICYFNMIHDNDGQIVDAVLTELNQSAIKLLNVRKDNLIGRKISQMRFLNANEKGNLIQRFTEILESSESYHLEEYYLSSFDKWLQVSFYSPENDSIAILMSDIDLNKKAEIELLKEKEKSEEANRVKSEFLANMSHEIRTPLNGILGMIDLTMMGALSDEQIDNLITAKDCITSLIDIINDVLDFSKIEAGKMKLDCINFNLIELLESTLKIHIPRINEKELDLKIDFEGVTMPLLLGDSKRIKQILNNLINNAIKFTDKGSIKVVARQKIFENNNEAIYLIVSVEDTGIGIEESKRPLLFQSFTQIDGSYTRQYGGTGLGLVISKQLVEMMSGTIGFLSNEDKGSIFQFAVPLQAANDQIELSRGNLPEKILCNNKRVLLVEDDKVNQIVVSKMLESEGAKVKIANNGMEAVKYCQEESFDLILMDIQMPEMDGIEATRLIRASSLLNGLTPIVALTAFALKGDEEIFRASGMDDYISKPVEKAQIMQLIMSYFSEPIKMPIESVVQESSQNEDESIHKTNGNAIINFETAGELMSRIKQIEIALEQENYILLEILAHQLKKKFESINAEELKNIAFKIELEIRKEKFENVMEQIVRIKKIIHMLQNG